MTILNVYAADPNVEYPTYVVTCLPGFIRRIFGAGVYLKRFTLSERKTLFNQNIYISETGKELNPNSNIANAINRYRMYK